MAEDFEQDFVEQAFGEEEDSPKPRKVKPPKQPKAAPLVGTPEQIAKAKRTSNTLIVLSLVLLLGIGALSWVGYQLLWPVIISPPDSGLGTVTVLPTDDDPNSGAIPLTVVYEKSTVPNLVALFGLTTAEALSRLGEGWVTTKVSEPATADPSAAPPPIYQLVTLSFAPKVVSVSGGDGQPGDYDYDQAVQAALPVANIYLSLNNQGKIIEVYYAVDLELIDPPDQSFTTLLSNDGYLRSILRSAGVEPRDFAYSPPDYGASLTYDRPDSDNRKVLRQSTIFSGRAAGEGLPTAWAVTVTYEFIPPVADPAAAPHPRRTLHINLS